jgi:glycine/D-amino acid oxidase-like deaminating enzyme
VANENAADRPLWPATAPPAPNCPALSGAHQAEVAIIGAGFTGLSTALHLAERGVAVRVLDADGPGAGASGRNGGQVIAGLRHFPADLIAQYGAPRGMRLYRLGAGAADFTFDLIARLGIDCAANRRGWIQAADTQVGMEQARSRVAAWREFGAPVRMLERDEFRALVGSDAYLGGWIDERCGDINPYAYACGLARAVIAAGGSVHGGSRALAIRRVGGMWRVETQDGSLSAERVLIATNALTDTLWPRLARAFVAVWSFQIATAPLSEAQRAQILAQRAPVSDTRRVLRYFRLDQAGRLIVGGKGTAGKPATRASFALQLAMLARLYPSLADQPIEFHWGGQVAITPGRLPQLFALADGVFASFGCNGKGVAWCTAIGPALADLLTGTAQDDLPLAPEPLRTIPFHRLRRVYVAAANTWLRLRDRFDRGVGS